MEINKEDMYINDVVMQHLRKYKIVDKISNEMYKRMCGICYKNYYGYEMDIDFAIKDAVGCVLLKNEIEIPGYKIWVA